MSDGGNIFGRGEGLGSDEALGKMVKRTQIVLTATEHAEMVVEPADVGSLGDAERIPVLSRLTPCLLFGPFPVAEGRAADTRLVDVVQIVARSPCPRWEIPFRFRRLLLCLRLPPPPLRGGYCYEHTARTS